MKRSLLAALASLILSACVTPPSVPSRPSAPGTTAPKYEAGTARYTRVDWSQLPGWNTADPAGGWDAWLQSCQVLGKRAGWREPCAAAATVDRQDAAAVRAYFQRRFVPWQLSDGDKASGLITGYYEPMLAGSLNRTGRATVPLYTPPRDMVTVDLAGLYPQLKGMRLRGRLVGNKLVPYWTAADIAQGQGVRGEDVIVWVEDPIEAIFLQIQGSGRVRLPDGSFVRVGYADQNGHPYNSIGRYLIAQGELKSNEASMQGIQAWARANPHRMGELLAANPSYVFFRKLPHAEGGPLGALGVPLTDGWSMAVDPRSTPLGAPVWLSTTRPNSGEPLQRLMYAQDTGGAIKGAVRADFFWGFGDEAGALAGRMKQAGSMWVLLPAGVAPPAGVQAVR